MDFSGTYTMTIAGNDVVTTRAMDVINPATGARFASVPVAGPDELDAAVAAARDALPAWKALGWDGRRERLIAAANAIEQHAELLCRTVHS